MTKLVSNNTLLLPKSNFGTGDKTRTQLYASAKGRPRIRNILKGILAPARLVPSSCASAPRNTREAGISSSTYTSVAIYLTSFFSSIGKIVEVMKEWHQKMKMVIGHGRSKSAATFITKQVLHYSIKQDWKDFQSSRLRIDWQYLFNFREIWSYYNIFARLWRVLQDIACSPRLT